MKNIYLPLFSGFYESIHSFDYESIIDSFIQDVKNNENHFIDILTEKDLYFLKNTNDFSDFSEIFDKYFDIDYVLYEKDYSKKYIETFKDFFIDSLEKDLGIDKIEFERIISPKYYNYDTDHIDVNISYNEGKILEYLKKEKNNFSSYIKERNKSYDGFISFMDDDYNFYIESIKNKGIESNQLTQIIEFYLYNEGILNDEGSYRGMTPTDLHVEVMDHIYYDSYIC